jgi:hypothetical protein
MGRSNAGAKLAILRVMVRFSTERPPEPASVGQRSGTSHSRRTIPSRACGRRDQSFRNYGNRGATRAERRGEVRRRDRRPVLERRPVLAEGEGIFSELANIRRRRLCRRRRLGPAEVSCPVAPARWRHRPGCADRSGSKPIWDNRVCQPDSPGRRRRCICRCPP